MIQIAFKMRVKNGKEKDFKEVVIKQLTASANNYHCLQYNFYQSLENPQEFILHEKWKDKQTWDGHLKNLEVIFGEKKEGSILPKKLEDYFESTENISYKEE